MTNEVDKTQSDRVDNLTEAGSFPKAKQIRGQQSVTRTEMHIKKQKKKPKTIVTK